MEALNNIDAALSEHRFWLQIMGDHARFIFFSLAPTETDHIVTAQKFIILFDQLLQLTQSRLSSIELEDLDRKAYDAVYRLREFKIQLLSKSLISELKSGLTASFFNDMINELEEYLSIINSIINGYIPKLHPLHYHMLWLTDAVGHSASILAELDFIEKDYISQAKLYEQQFQELNVKALMMNGYLRTGMNSFPSLNRLNEQAWHTIRDFMEFLEAIRDQRMDGKILGTLMPLMADHMYREECYYILKLSQSASNIKKPDCDPASPRLEL